MYYREGLLFKISHTGFHTRGTPNDYFLTFYLEHGSYSHTPKKALPDTLLLIAPAHCAALISPILLLAIYCGLNSFFYLLILTLIAYPYACYFTKSYIPFSTLLLFSSSLHLLLCTTPSSLLILLRGPELSQ